ncbi:hypothetical protein E2C01_084925 [Portunus trituberculatus]|uniref:Uncharacterized protein n=1 Tax=Portunus trituberculatus TaxID=210409 RepID=A0A5B7IZK8_PORTR|nr:hypothetical protein [Portunus trituberculatus]
MLLREVRGQEERGTQGPRDPGAKGPLPATPAHADGHMDLVRRLWVAGPPLGRRATRRDVRRHAFHGGVEAAAGSRPGG